MAAYKRVTYENRIQIEAYLEAGLSGQDIAKNLGFHKSTVSRELKRNTRGKKYKAGQAEGLARKRFESCRRKSKFTSQVKTLIREKLQEGWSPLRLAGRLRREGAVDLSVQAIYQRLRCDPAQGREYLVRYQRRGGGRLCQRQSQKIRLTIHDRPELANQRKTLGHWERDGMYGKFRQQCLVFTERKSRFTVVKRMGTGKPKTVTDLTEEVFREIPIRHRSATNDRGPEFRDSHNLSVPVYFCDIQKPQQKGSVEHMIGQLRQYLKRSTDLGQLTDKELDEIQERLNLRPLRVLNYRTPYEELFNIDVALVS